MLDITLDMSSDELEKELCNALFQVDLVGELPVDEAGFRRLTKILRGVGYLDGEPNIHRVPKAVFMTSMVFCARYSQESARNFWTPYAKLVWKREEADQVFQNHCRAYFRERIRPFLIERYGFYFPSQFRYASSNTDFVVQDIYTHAIIPYHLQDDFADWLRTQDWSLISQYPPEELALELAHDTRLQYVAPGLRRFIQEKETAFIAASLIRTMATAASFIRDYSADKIASMLENKPIEHSLWLAIQDTLTEQKFPRLPPTRSNIQPEWVWSLEHDELRLRLKSFPLTSEYRPYRWVWGDSEDSFETYSNVSYVNPWRGKDGLWMLDEELFENAAPSGHLYLVSAENKILREFQIPAIMNDPILFFRIVNQNSIGIHLDPLKELLGGGEWLIILQHRAHLLDENEQPIQPRQAYPVPEPLAHLGLYRKAGQFNLPLPYNIVYDTTKVTIEGKSAALTLRLEGNQIEGLAAYIPPVFSNRTINLIVTHLPRRAVNRLTLWLIPQGAQAEYHSFDKLESNGLLQEKADSLTIDLESLLPDGIGTYTIEIRQNLQLATLLPLTFSILPNVTINSPSKNSVYTPINLPKALLLGVSQDQIEARATVEAVENEISVTWNDLSVEPRMVIKASHQRVALAWDVKRVYGWIEPTIKPGVLTPAELSDACLMLRGPKYQNCQIGPENGPKRSITLNAKGQYQARIVLDQFGEMLQNSNETLIRLFMVASGDEWPIFDFVQQPRITDFEAVYIEDEHSLIFSIQVQEIWHGQFCLQLFDAANPLTGTLTLADFTELKSGEECIEINLVPGTYLIQLLSNGTPLSLPTEKAVISVGSAEESQPDLDLLVQWVSGWERTGTLTVEAGKELLRMLITRDAHAIENFTPDQLYTLATLPDEAIDDFSAVDLQHIWSVLSRIRHVHQTEGWLKDYGLLPAWAVTDKLFNFYFQKTGWMIRVRPAYTFEKGQRGYGSARLTFNTHRENVYAAWEPVSDRQLRIYFKLPPDDVDEVHFFDIDEDDMTPIYQCAGCGQLVRMHRNRTKYDPYMELKHKHNQSEAKFYDIVYDKKRQLLASFTLGNNLPERLNLITPNDVVEHGQIPTYLKRSTQILVPEAKLTSAEGYRWAVADWVNRYHSGGQAKEALDRLVSEHQIKQTRQGLKQWLVQNAEVPSLTALERLNTVLQWQPAEQPLLALDETVILLAAKLRTDGSQIGNPTIPTQVGELAEMLRLAIQGCPVLLEWAFMWVELFNVHALC